jgi:hypothetical protein
MSNKTPTYLKANDPLIGLEDWLPIKAENEEQAAVKWRQAIYELNSDEIDNMRLGYVFPVPVPTTSGVAL